MQFTPYALPAMVALLAKVGIFFYARYSKVHNLQTRLYLLFLFCLSIQNLMEIRFFTSVEGLTNQPSTSGTVYFSVSILAIAFLLHLALVMATSWRREQENLSTAGLILLYMPAIILEVLIWNTSLVVAGFEPMAYTYTRVPGPLFFLWEIYAIGYLCTAAALLVYGTKTQVTTFQRLQNKLLLIGFLPIVAVVLAVIGLQHFGFRSFNATATLPLATTFFLAVTAYATHQYRLFDIQFFIPWSKLRKRKTEFYKRIQSLIAEIADMRSVHRVVESLSDALGCPVALVGGPKPVFAMAGEALGVARFPVDELKKIDRIVVANEIADAMPDTHALMKRHKVAAIVPFHPHSNTAASWMLLGDAFSEQVYSPLDFKVVETLFARLADHFLDTQLLLRSQLAEAREEMRALQRRLASAWEQLDENRQELRAVQEDNRRLRDKDNLLLHHDLALTEADMLELAEREKKTLEEYVAEFEARLIAETLRRCGGDRSRAAEVLGMPLITLSYKMRDYGLMNLQKEN